MTRMPVSVDPRAVEEPQERHWEEGKSTVLPFLRACWRAPWRAQEGNPESRCGRELASV